MGDSSRIRTCSAAAASCVVLALLVASGDAAQADQGEGQHRRLAGAPKVPAPPPPPAWQAYAVSENSPLAPFDLNDATHIYKTDAYDGTFSKYGTDGMTNSLGDHFFAKKYMNTDFINGDLAAEYTSKGTNYGAYGMYYQYGMYGAYGMYGYYAFYGLGPDPYLMFYDYDGKLLDRNSDYVDYYSPPPPVRFSFRCSCSCFCYSRRFRDDVFVAHGSENHIHFSHLHPTASYR